MLAEALLAASDLSTAVEAALEHAAELIERMGARVRAPALLEWRAELAAIGATRPRVKNCWIRLIRAIKKSVHRSTRSDWLPSDKTASNPSGTIHAIDADYLYWTTPLIEYRHG